MAGRDVEAAAVKTLDPNERLLVLHKVDLIRSRRFPPPPAPPERPPEAGTGAERVARGLVVGVLILAIPFMIDRLPTFHGRTGEGAPGSLAVDCARAFERFARVYLAVSDRRLLLLEQLPPDKIAWSPPVHLAISFEVPRSSVAAAQRRRWLNGARLRLDFYDTSWLVLQVESFFPTKGNSGLIVAALRS